MSKPKPTDNKPTHNLQCSMHKKEIEGFCSNCQSYLCSSCMFSTNNLHKSHSLMNMKELSVYLRNLMLDNSSSLRHEYLEDIEIGIRQAKGALLQQSHKLIQQIDKEVEGLIAVIKERRNNIVSEINSNLEDELLVLKGEEAKWKERQILAKKILEVQTNGNDSNVNSNMELIIEGIKEITREVMNKEYRAIVEYDVNIKPISSNTNTNTISNSNSNNNCNSNKKLEIKDLIEMMENMFIIKEEHISNLPYKS